MIETIPFGRTGHQSTRAIFGGAALGNVSQDEADQTLQVLLDYGINHIDTAASYGHSEERIGPWMAGHRNDFFLATKTGERTYDKAHAEIQRSLQRLQVEQIDLLQLHCLVEPDEWETAMSEQGALKAAIEAREAGQVRFIGVTGHGLNVARMHLKSLERFDFDSVLLPFSYVMMQNPDYAADFWQLRDLCRQRNIAVQTIKSITRRPWGDQPQTAACWYQPLTEQADIDRAAHWVLGHEGLFLNTVADIHVVPRVFEAAARFESSPSEEEMQELFAAREMAPLFV